MQHSIPTFAPFVLVLALSVAPAWGLGRFVVVNGQLQDAYSLAVLDAAVGEPVPNGRYWLNYSTGEWGYEGGPPQGIVGQDTGGGGSSGGRKGGKFFEDDVSDFCARNPEVGC
jgi:hypothetical protein